jgi:hypothetical protein
MTAGVSSIGGNCIMKHFLPLTVSSQSNGYFVNYLYLYYLLFDELRLVKPLTSNPKSGEFYVVCKGFRGISENNYEKLLKILDDFKEGMCVFDKNDIPQDFVDSICEFYKIVSDKNVKTKTIHSRIFTCKINMRKNMKTQTKKLIDKDCRVYLNTQFIKKINNDMFGKWVHHNKFKPY